MRRSALSWVLAAGVLAGGVSPGMAQEDKPYEVVDGKVGQGTYNGYRRYHNSCHQCHGPDGLGSTYAPNLTESLKSLSYEQFADTVINGREVKRPGGGESVMPSFGMNPDVANYLDDIYGYLKARSDGVLPRGRPERLPK